MRAAFAPKAIAAQQLLAAVAATPLQGVALFSSVAGQLGSAGQANYGAANTTLDAAADRLQSQVTETCRIATILQATQLYHSSAVDLNVPCE